MFSAYDLRGVAHFGRTKAEALAKAAEANRSY